MEMLDGEMKNGKYASSNRKSKQSTHCRSSFIGRAYCHTADTLSSLLESFRRFCFEFKSCLS
jgi:hypothetical protein